ncbi:STAS domain-containing protein [Streptomyces purpureus]|uniref:STAS domain-containing protein n=1 Tax=Streptomyces purpureus TaxID=1951 RepID=UPI003570FA3E
MAPESAPDAAPGTPGNPGDGDTAGPGRFRVAVRQAPGAVVLALDGELDHDTAGPLRAALDEEISAGSGRLVVDCSSLRFCDSTGLNVLLRARLAALDAGGSLELAGLRPPVVRMFEITGAHAVFRVHSDLDEALAQPPHER